MKAVICTEYGSPDILQLQEVAKPNPKDNEVRIRIHASTVGPATCAFRKGDPYIVRLIYGFRKPRLAILGTELAGEIDAVGRNVKLFNVGDQVFGTSANSSGAHAEYKCLPESGVLVIKSENMNYEDAAGIVDGAPTALTFLRDMAKIKSGQKVLINGASGSVGIYAVQLAKYYGAEVTGVCSSANIQLVKSYGADKVVDYTQEDFTQTGYTYDIIFDAVGKSSFSRCKGSLMKQGMYLTTAPTLGIIVQMLWTLKRSKRAIFATAGLMQNKDNLMFLRELAEAGKLQPVIDRRYPLEQIVEAHRYVDTERKKGNVIITV
jgi:NADPH:quinone reductase-like Zn-dependent oxidoreductase